ncbi:MAG: transcriptional regulator NrdR [bacterium]|nr:transcriptional regulator NrdR [bacterium]
MHCPVCNNKSTRVVDSRALGEGDGVRRRRECERARCGYRFSTIEEPEMLDVTVVKRDGMPQAYSREKLIGGLKRALEKRPHTADQMKKLVQRIERDIRKVRTGEITSEDIGEIIMKQLKRIDKVAYFRFASVYYSFEDLETFDQELQKLVRKQKERSKKG